MVHAHKHLTRCIKVNGKLLWVGVWRKLNDSLVISSKDRRPGLEGHTWLHHRDADLGLRLVGPILHVQGSERAEGLEGPAPNTVISRTPYCIRTGQRRKAVPSHPYRGLVLGKVVSWLVAVCVHGLHVEANCFHFATIGHRS